MELLLSCPAVEINAQDDQVVSLPSFFIISSIIVKGNLIISSFFGLIVFEFDHNQAEDKQ